MDDFYDKAKAVQTLDKLIVEQTAAAASPQMHNLDLETTENFDLTDDIKCLTHARQSVTLTGLGSTSFDRTVENGRCMFSRYTSNAKLLPRPEFLATVFLLIDTETDPQGLLVKVDQTRYVHMEDNMVHYYVLTDGDDNNRYTLTTPIIFQIGDIIEIQTSMMCIPQKGNFTVKLVLRSIIFLNGSLTMEATNACTLITLTPTQPPKHLKRRNPYVGGKPLLQKTQCCQDHTRIDIETDEGGGSRVEEAARGQQAHLHDEVASEDQAVVTDTCIEA
ncbi:hypothetical protein BDN71DRAFT_1505941 [Pleurotus eryngii]|uniref:Uncharacterized protein n=1 Tax=Pleurotus eryngii TaxID=5323 RepID=A0A9P6A0Z4_PLEER|nr:hypothetical protein BDN71DRAFT_1505941 [Pleurotus eryngii]